MSSSAIDLVAAGAHALWCARMVDAGWVHGEYCEEERRHDALVDFAMLSPSDRTRTIEQIRQSGVLVSLADLVTHPRGPARPIELSELRPGLRVRLADADPPVEGYIVSWSGSGECLDRVRVEWDDGDRTDHIPAEQELVRIGW